MIDRRTPTTDAAIRPTVRATPTTASTTTKSMTVDLDSRKRSGSVSIMRSPTTISTPESVATGVQAMNEPSTRAATTEVSPSTTPEIRVFAPLE